MYAVKGTRHDKSSKSAAGKSPVSKRDYKGIYKPEVKRKLVKVIKTYRKCRQLSRKRKCGNLPYVFRRPVRWETRLIRWVCKAEKSPP